jgi:hypothetical protein
MANAANCTTIIKKKIYKLKEKYNILKAYKLSKLVEVLRSKKRQRPNKPKISS